MSSHPLNSQFSIADSSHPLLGSFHPDDGFERFYPREEKVTNTNGFNNDNTVTGYQPITRRYRDVSDTLGDDDGLGTGTRHEEMSAPQLISEEAMKMSPPISSRTLQTLDRSYRIPKRRMVPPRNGQDYKSTGHVMQTVPVYSGDERSPDWGQVRKSTGVKRGRGYEGGQRFTDQHRSAPEDERLNQEDGDDAGEYVGSEYEHGRGYRIRLAPAPGEDTVSSEAKRQARLKRFRQDFGSLNTSNPSQERSSRSRCDEAVIMRPNPAYHDEGIRVRQPDMSFGATFTGSNENETQANPHLPTGSDGSTSMLADRKRRPIIIDGCNLAFGRSEGKCFESQAIQVCVDHFLKEGFSEIIVVLPEFRLSDPSCKDPQILQELKRKGMLITSWSGTKLNGQRYASYDDIMIVRIAHRRGGVIISNDRYRDILQAKPEWAETIDERVVGFRFMPGVPDEIMFPSDPFGRYGPSLDQLLRF